MNIKLRFTIEVETDGETNAEELGWMLNMLRFELAHWPRWRGRIGRVELVSPRKVEEGRETSAPEGHPPVDRPSPPESAQE